MARLLVRADGNSQIGYGHLMRCMALANESVFNEVWWFSKDDCAGVLAKDLRKEIHFTQIENETVFFGQLRNADFVLLDGYHFDLDYQKQLKQKGAQIILIDDLANEPICADIVINPSPGISAKHYQNDIAGIYLLGIEYALLRAPFLALAQQKQLQKEPGTVLICMGGADPANFTQQVLASCLSAAFSRIHVVIGAAYTHPNPKDQFTDPRIELHSHLSAKEMAALMSKCEFGIYPASGILLEGLAAQQRIITGITAENQREVFEGHSALGTVISAGNFQKFELESAIPNLYSFDNSTKLIDGLSIQRIWKLISRLEKAQHLVLRRANSTDLHLTFEWATDQNIRRYALTQHQISFAEHQNWFEKKISSKSCYYYILEENQVAIGSIRFDLIGQYAQISYLLGSAAQGKGLGLLLLLKGMNQLQNDAKPPTFSAFLGEVLPENSRSIRIFEQLGFETENQQVLLRFTRKLDTHV
ncbi:MAG: UDP-2,4-diacetamido-2,4,6-trideoxy-beta-L-altropyranose hydrolase [Flavobacteriales bacterium]